MGEKGNLEFMNKRELERERERKRVSEREFTFYISDIIVNNK